ncbi:TetR/AcrR family transcriptional regulator [Mucilaginibacter sp. JRF]|uniref:TetR/AcrR family transcriptional regulator n=1 Tax=Mucilaginibacter sp. JRF TaxID=2780088 RepID=UPI001D163E0F|nr:TetR/AcrR family transcriptional regulator [Mucilaginibacter sp. JRF]
MKKKQILNSAIKVLNKDLYAPLEKIANEAQINKRTLYRYFSDRDTLIAACYLDMMQTCSRAMLIAVGSHNDPIAQLEAMLYAAMDCGVKYVFLTTLEINPVNMEIHDKDLFAEYEQARNKWFSLVPQLQQENIIDHQLSPAWIRHLFINTVRTCVQAQNSGDVAPNDLKRLVWLTFSRSIGISK